MQDFERHAARMPRQSSTSTAISLIMPESTARLSSSLQDLSCGNISGDTHLARCMRRLGSSIDQLIRLLGANFWTPVRQDDLVVAFLGRGMLEACCTALLGRLDPFRLLVVRMTQSSPDYTLDKRNESAIQWSGDILAASPPPKGQNLWAQPHLKLSRALLADYSDAIFWQPAFSLVLDQTPPHRGGQWLADLRLRESHEFIPMVRHEFSTLYSRCSKSVHIESVIDIDRESPAEGRTIVHDTLRLVSTLGFVFWGIDHAPFRPSHESALEALEEIQKFLKEQEK